MKTFLGGIVCCFIISQIVSCTGNSNNKEFASESNPANIPETFSYSIFTNSDSSYGFDIILSEKIYIHQPVIPCKEGLQGFTTLVTAEKVATLMVVKLQSQDFHFLITETDIDTILKNEDQNNYSNHVKVQSFFTSPVNSDTKDSALTFFSREPLLPLPDAPVKGQWKSKGIVPFGLRTAGFNFTIGNCIFIGGGEYKDQTSNDFWCFNGITEEWTCLASAPGGFRMSGVAFAIYGKGFMGLGAARGVDGRDFKNDFFEYDPAKNKWFTKAVFPGSARVDASSFTINGKGYAGSGYAETYAADFYEYDPGKDKWDRIADFGGGPVSSAIGISTGNHGFLVAGDRVPENKRFVYEYVPAQDSWIKRNDFPGHPRYFLTGCGIDSNLLIAGAGGAEGGAMRFRDFFVYNIAKDTWNPTADYLVSKAGNTRPIGGNVNGEIFMGTGFNGVFLNDWNVYEYYYSVRTDTGTYDETTCYPLKYNGEWQLYQECTSKNCYAGASIKTKENLGNFCYSSLLTNSPEQLSLQQNNKSSNFLLAPRSFNMSFEKKSVQPVGIRLFFTKEEIQKLLKNFQQTTGRPYLLSELKILQHKETQKQVAVGKKDNALSNYQIISPQLNTYGFKGQTIVASFSTDQSSSQFFLSVQTN